MTDIGESPYDAAYKLGQDAHKDFEYCTPLYDPKFEELKNQRGGEASITTMLRMYRKGWKSIEECAANVF